MSRDSSGRRYRRAAAAALAVGLAVAALLTSRSMPSPSLPYAEQHRAQGAAAFGSHSSSGPTQPTDIAPGATPAVPNEARRTLVPPRAGRYVYALTTGGESGAPQQGTMVELIEVVDAGAHADIRIRAGSPGMETITYQRWDPDSVLWTGTEERPSNGEPTRCDIAPPAPLLRVPFEEPISHTWKSARCSGTFTSRLVAEEVVADGTGRRWPALKLEQRLTNSSGSIETTLWFSLDLGVEVRAERRAISTLYGRTIKTMQQTILAAHPGDGR